MNNLVNRIIKAEFKKTQSKNWVISPIGLETIFSILISCSNETVKNALLQILELKKADLALCRETLYEVLKERSENEDIYLSSRSQINYTTHYVLNNQLIEEINKLFVLDTQAQNDEMPKLEIINHFKFGDK